MLKNIFAILIFLSTITNAQNKNPLTLEEIFKNNLFAEEKIASIQWRPNSQSFSFSKKNATTGYLDIYEHNVETGENSLLLSDNELNFNSKKIKLSKYQWTDDGKFLLIQGPSKSIWRHSTQAAFYLYNLETKKIISLAENSDRLRNVKLSPNGKLVGFVKDHNIYVVDLETNVEKAITKNGNNNILNGEFDWVYEEEFELADAWRWSPDGNKIAYWQFDQTHVKEFNLVNELPHYNEIDKLKYPKVGEKNAIIKIGVFDLKNNRTTFMDIGENEDIYIPRIFWTNSSEFLTILRLNRKQDILDFIMAETKTGKSKTIINEKNSTWVEVTHDIRFLKSKDQIVISSEKNGFRHAYLYDYNGKLITQITDGNWEITELAGVDEQNNWLYYYGKKDSPLQQNVYRTKLDGSSTERISPKDGWHKPKFSPNYKYYIDEFNSILFPNKTVLNKTDGTEIRILGETNLENVKNHNFYKEEFIEIKTTDDVILNAFMIKPKNFDENKKYPVVVYGYGGPGSQKVIDKWGSTQNHFNQFLAEQGYIVFCLDNRGTGGRGKAFKDLSYGDLSKWSVNDQVEGAKYLATLPFVDKEKIGFWGWSGGAYLTIGLLTKASKYFKVGAAVAPVTDFKNYDAMWAERHMNIYENNIDGYYESKWMNFVDSLKGNLLIIHGMADDNVHYQNTIQFIQECIEKNKQVDMFLYPKGNHRIGSGTALVHMFTKIKNYFDQHLLK